MVLLDDQDRSLWNRTYIEEGSELVARALSSRRFGPYTLQAAIAAVHAEARTAAATDWAQIVGLYDVLLRAEPSPVVELNRAVAVAMRDGPESGLALWMPSSRAATCANTTSRTQRVATCAAGLAGLWKPGLPTSARLALIKLEPERQFLERRLRQLADLEADKKVTSAAPR